MNDFSVVDVFHSQAYLREPVEDLDFGEWPTSLILDSFLQVTTYI